VNACACDEACGCDEAGAMEYHIKHPNHEIHHTQTNGHGSHVKDYGRPFLIREALGLAFNRRRGKGSLDACQGKGHTHACAPWCLGAKPVSHRLRLPCWVPVAASPLDTLAPLRWERNLSAPLSRLTRSPTSLTPLSFMRHTG
jgi:hypothetical protein